MLAENRNLFLGLAFAVTAAIAFLFAKDTYREPVGRLQAGERLFTISLEHVNRYKGLFPGRSLQAWLGADQASVAAKQLRLYRSALAGSLLCGFCTVFFLGLHIEAMRADRDPAATID